MNIKLHNKYEISIGNKTYIAYNTLLDTIYDKISNLEQYTSHIAIGTGTSRKSITDTNLGNYLRTFETRTEEIQSDISKNTLFIKKIVSINEDDTSVFSFSELGLTNTNDFDPVIFNHVLITNQDGEVITITRNLGDAMEIKVTIYLELTPQSQALFIQGENQLIKQILGEDLKIEDNKLYALRGENLVPNEHTIRSTPDLTKAVVCKKSFAINTDGSVNITYTAELGEGETEEILLVYNNEVVVRLNTLEFNPIQTITNTYSCQPSNIIEIDKNVKNINSVMQITPNGNIADTTHTITVFGKKLTDKVVDIFDQPFDSNTPRFVSKDGKMIAFLFNSYVHIYKYNNYKFTKVNTTQIPASNIMKLFMFEDTILILMTTNPYIRIFKIINNNAIEQEVNMQMYDSSIYPYNWLDAEATLTKNNKIVIGIIVNDENLTPIVIRLSQNANGSYSDSFTRPNLTTAKKVYSVYQNPFCEPRVSFITDTFNGATYYFIEEFLEDTSTFASGSDTAYTLLNATLGIQVAGRTILSQKDTYPYLIAYYYPNFETVSYTYSNGIKHFTSKDGNYIIAKYQDSTYKIFNMHSFDNLTEFENNFPSYVNFSDIVSFEFVGDYLLVFTSSKEEPLYAIAIKNAYTRLDNLSDISSKYEISYNKYDLIGSRDLEGVKVTFSMLFAINTGDSNAIQ